MDKAENQINDMEHKETNNEKKKNPKKSEDGTSSLWDNFQSSNIHIGVPEEEEEQEIGHLFEKIMKENFPNLVKEIDMQVQEAQSPK